MGWAQTAFKTTCYFLRCAKFYLSRLLTQAGRKACRYREGGGERYFETKAATSHQKQYQKWIAKQVKKHTKLPKQLAKTPT